MKLIISIAVLLFTFHVSAQESFVVHLKDGEKIPVDGFITMSNTSYSFKSTDGKKKNIKVGDIRALTNGDGNVIVAGLPTSTGGKTIMQSIILYSDEYILAANMSEDYMWFNVLDRDWNVLESNLDMHPTSFPKGKAKKQLEENMENIDKVAAYFSDCDDLFEKMRENVKNYNYAIEMDEDSNCGASESLKVEDFKDLE